jgi:hypothetical protein
MNLALEISFVALCGVLAVEWLALQGIVRELASLRRLAEAEIKASPAHRLGKRIPPFRAVLLDSASPISDEDLAGRTTPLLFVEPSRESTTPRPDTTGAVFHTLWHQFEDALHVVCCCSEDEARSFRDHFSLIGGRSARLNIIVDETRALAKLFSVESFPSAAVISADGTLSKVGEVQMPQQPGHANVQSRRSR